MLNDAEVFRSHPKQCGSVNFGLPAYEVGLLQMKILAILILPNFFRVIPVVQKNGGGVPVGGFSAGMKGTALQYQDVFAGDREMERGDAAAGSAPNDDCVVVCAHSEFLLSLALSR